MSEKQTTTKLKKVELSQSERFTQEVMKQFTNEAGEVKLTNFQKKLIQNYFIKIDQTLKDLERKRMAKDEKFRDKLAFTWQNVNLPKLAVDVVAFSSVGLDPVQPNHINPIPYKNSSSNKFDITFILGYKGIELKARKYGFDVPDDVIVELVYKNDNFKQIKRDINNRVESYIFEVVDDFNRGELVGGFYYHVFNDKPEKNKLRVFSKEDIDKRKPDYASVEFWGGERDKWENGKKVGKENVKGWYEEMAYKTIYRSAFNAITIDSEKIDQHYLAMMEKEREQHDNRIMLEIKENANTETIGFEEVEEEQQPLPESDKTQIVEPIVQQEPVKQEAGLFANQSNNQPGF